MVIRFIVKIEITNFATRLHALIKDKNKFSHLC